MNQHQQLTMLIFIGGCILIAITEYRREDHYDIHNFMHLISFLITACAIMAVVVMLVL